MLPSPISPSLVFLPLRLSLNTLFIFTSLRLCKFHSRRSSIYSRGRPIKRSAPISNYFFAFFLLAFEDGNFSSGFFLSEVFAFFLVAAGGGRSPSSSSSSSSSAFRFLLFFSEIFAFFLPASGDDKSSSWVSFWFSSSSCLHLPSFYQTSPLKWPLFPSSSFRLPWGGHGLTCLLLARHFLTGAFSLLS